MGFGLTPLLGDRRGFIPPQLKTKQKQTWTSLTVKRNYLRQMYPRKKIHETCLRNGKYLQRQSWDCLRQYNNGCYLEKVVQRPLSSFKWWKAIECTCNNWCMTQAVFFSIGRSSRMSGKDIRDLAFVWFPQPIFQTKMYCVKDIRIRVRFLMFFCNTASANEKNINLADLY